jgi:hypothetical protein
VRALTFGAAVLGAALASGCAGSSKLAESRGVGPAPALPRKSE